MAIKPKYREKTIAEKQAERVAERAYFAQLKQEQQAQREQAQAEHNAFVQRVQAIRREQAAAAAAGEQWIPDEAIPSVRDVYRQTRAEELQAKADAEQARRDALTPRQLWVSTLTWQEQQRVQKYEQINHMPYPVPGLD